MKKPLGGPITKRALRFEPFATMRANSHFRTFALSRYHIATYYVVTVASRISRGLGRATVVIPAVGFSGSLRNASRKPPLGHAQFGLDENGTIRCLDH